MTVQDYTNFIHNSAELGRAYKNDKLYKKTWNQQSGKVEDLTGLDLFIQEVIHSFSWLTSEEQNEKEKNEKFITLFDKCLPKSLDKELSFDALKARVKARDVADAYKSVKIREQGELIVSDSIDKIDQQLSKIVNQCSSTIQNIYSKNKTTKDLSNKTIAKYNFEARVLDFIGRSQSVVTAGSPGAVVLPETDLQKFAFGNDSEINKFEEIDLTKQNRIVKEFIEKRRDLQTTALKLHESYTRSDKSALQLARENVTLQKLFADTSSEEEKQMGEFLLNIIRYGPDSTAVMKGEKSPSFFSDLTKIWNTIKWWSPFADRLKEAKVDMEAFKDLPPNQKEIIEDLVNHKNKEVGYNIFQNPSYPSYLGSVNPQPFSCLPLINRVVDAFTTSIVSSLPLSTTAPLLFVPFVVKGKYFYPDHVVIITFDPQRREIQYYDPQGLPPDHPDRMTYENFNLAEAIEDLRDQWGTLLGKPVGIVRNHTIHQEDTQNCAIYVCKYMDERSKGKSFEDVCINGPTHDEIIAYRDTMARELVSHLTDTNKANAAQNMDEVNPEGEDWSDKSSSSSAIDL